MKFSPEPIQKANRSDSLTTAINEWYGWVNWAAQNGINISGSPQLLAHHAGQQLGLDKDRINRILKSVNGDVFLEPAALRCGGEESCWKKIYFLDKPTFEAKCPAYIKAAILHDWKTGNRSSGDQKTVTCGKNDSARERGAVALLEKPEQQNNTLNSLAPHHKIDGGSRCSGSGSGNRRDNGAGGSGGNGGDGGDGGDNIVPFPSLAELITQPVNSSIDEIINQGLTGSKLHKALNAISHQTPWRIDQLKTLYEKKLADLERIDLRDNTLEQLESLLSASAASLDLNDYLHPNLAKPLLHLASRLSLKPELYLTTLLTVASSLHHPQTRIWLSKEDDFDQPANLFSAIIAASSQKKSPLLKAIATKPLRVLQKEADREYKRQLEAHEQELREWEKDKTPDKGAAPEKPERAIHYFTKATGEGLEYQAARQPKQGMLYLSDELPAIIYGQNAYRQGKGSDKQDILSYYDGTGHVTLRAEGVKSELDSILLSILGGIQPKVMQKLLADCEDSDGNWARFLFVSQPAVPARLHPDGGQIDFTGLLSGLYRDIRSLPQREYTLSPEAFKLFQQAYDRYEQNRVTDPLVGMQSVWGKCEGRVGRLALNLHIINALAANEIPSDVIEADTVARAIALTDYYAMQVKALYTEFSDSDALAPHLAKVIEMSLKFRKSTSEGWLKAHDVYLAITKKHRPNPETVREWFTELVVLGKGEVRGSGRSLQFRVFLPNEPNEPAHPQQLDKIRQVLDKSSNTEMTIYQDSQEKLDKLDNLDDFPKNAMDVQTLDARVGSKTGLEKNSVLDELSNLSNFAQNAKPVEETALDDLSNKSSNLDAEPSTTGVVENALEAKEAIRRPSGNAGNL